MLIDKVETILKEADKKWVIHISLREVALKICYLIPKSEENPDGYGEIPKPQLASDREQKARIEIEDYLGEHYPDILVSDWWQELVLEGGVEMTDRDYEYEKAVYNQQKEWEQEQEYFASESAAAEANIKAQEEEENEMGMTAEEELREKIRNILASPVPMENRKDWAEFASEEILALVKEALPELAKEAGLIVLHEDELEEFVCNIAEVNGYTKPSKVNKGGEER